MLRKTNRVAKRVGNSVVKAVRSVKVAKQVRDNLGRDIREAKRSVVRGVKQAGRRAVSIAGGINPVTVPYQITGAAWDAGSNFVKSRKYNLIGGDKFFHCRANYNATKRGPIAELAIKVATDAWEVYQNRNAIDKDDLKANRVGRRGALEGKTINESCGIYKVNGLREEYLFPKKQNKNK